MKKSETTIELSDPRTGETTGPISQRQFKNAEKFLGLKPGREKGKEEKHKDDHPEYWQDHELDDLGKQLVLEQHNHLLEAEIAYLLTSKTMSVGGRAVAGKAQKLSGLIRYYARYDFLIIVSSEFWLAAQRDQRQALTDHELCHCSVEFDKGGGRHWILKGHDIEEFGSIVDRHGLWTEDLKKFGQAIGRQLNLFKEDKKDKD